VGTLTGKDTTANGLNDNGDVVGNSGDHAFVYQHKSGALNDLGAAQAEGINNKGVIIGTTLNGSPPAATLWYVTGGSLVLPVESFGNALNESGTLVGDENNGYQDSQAVVWTGSDHVLSALGYLCTACQPSDRPSSSAMAVNSQNTVVGQSTASRALELTHAFMFKNGKLTDLGALNNSDVSMADGINTAEDVVGESSTSTDAGTPSHAFLIHQGTMSDLGTLSGDSGSSAAAINDIGEIVGWSSHDLVPTPASGTATTVMRAFFYANGKMYDLNTLIDPTSPIAGFVKLTEATAVNCNGWISANGTDSRDMRQHAYLLVRKGDLRADCPAPQ
jgi:probable HAF family extracellular repeat protein